MPPGKKKTQHTNNETEHIIHNVVSSKRRQAKKSMREGRSQPHLCPRLVYEGAILEQNANTLQLVVPSGFSERCVIVLPAHARISTKGAGEKHAPTPGSSPPLQCGYTHVRTHGGSDVGSQRTAEAAGTLGARFERRHAGQTFRPGIHTTSPHHTSPHHNLSLLSCIA